MTETARGRSKATWTVGQLAREFGVTVRTLHHYDEIGLLTPSGRSASGYRLYTLADLTRLQHVVVYRRLGFALEEIALLLAQPPDRATRVSHLRRQRAAVMQRLDEMRGLVEALDRAMEKEMKGIQLTQQEQKELFGEGFSDAYAEEAEQRWGNTESWRQSKARTASYTKEDWVKIKAEASDLQEQLAQAMRDGHPASSERAMDLAEQARQHIHRWFYDCSRDLHARLGEMYVADPRFQKTYEDTAPGLAQYVHEAIVANAKRA